MLDLNLAPDQDDNMVEVVQEVEEGFIPLLELNDEEIANLDAFNNLGDPGVQLANALQMPHQDAVNFSDSGSLSGSASSVNMNINEENPAVDLNLILGLPIQQQFGPFLPKEIMEEDLWPNNFQEENQENNQADNI